jgi:hypothetical protein
LRCVHCGEDVPRAEYNIKNGACNQCYPLVKQERRAKRLSRASGVSRSAAELRKEQDGRCAICGVLEEDAARGRLAVDHDHETNAIRGLLCNNCNVGLGHFKDNEKLLLAAIEYLARTAA